MSDPKPPTRNCAGCNEPNPPHEMIDQRCLRCTHRELIATKAELERVCKDADDLAAGRITLNEIAVRNGTLTAAFGTEAALVMANQFYALLKDKEVVNYLEMQFTPTNTDRGRIVATLRWEDGKTPHELRAEAEQNLADCKNALQIMTNAEDDARRELVRVRLRLDALTNAASVACAGYTTYKSEAAEYFGRDDDLASVPIEYMEELTAALVAETKDAPTPPTPEPSRNTAGLHEPVWDSRNSDEPKTEVGCAHAWHWNLCSGEIWGQPSDLNGYDTTLIIGKCSKCGVIHKPEPKTEVL